MNRRSIIVFGLAVLVPILAITLLLRKDRHIEMTHATGRDSGTSKADYRGSPENPIKTSTNTVGTASIAFGSFVDRVQSAAGDPDSLLALIKEIDRRSATEVIEIYGTFQKSLGSFTPEQLNELFVKWPPSESRAIIFSSLKNYLVEEDFDINLVTKVITSISDILLATELMEFYLKRSQKLSDPEELRSFIQRFPESFAGAVRNGIELRIRNTGAADQFPLIESYLEVFQDDSQITNMLVARAVGALMREKAVDVAAWLLTQPSELVQGGDSAYIAHLLGEMDTETAFAYVDVLLSHEEAERAGRVARHIAETYSLLDPEAALAWASTLPSTVTTRDEAIRIVSTVLAAKLQR